MNLNNSSFTFRDYLVYLFPGVLLFWAYFLLNQDQWVLIKNDNFLLILMFFVGGYFLGYISNAFATRTVIKISDDIIGNQFSNIISKLSKSRNDESKFFQILDEKLKKYWGEDLHSGGEYNLLYLCWRDIQNSEHRGIDYLLRLVSLWNFCTSTIIPSALLLVLMLIEGSFLLSFLFLLIFIFSLLSRVSLREEFARNVYRIWYVIQEDKHNKSHQRGQFTACFFALKKD